MHLDKIRTRVERNQWGAAWDIAKLLEADLRYWSRGCSSWTARPHESIEHPSAAAAVSTQAVLHRGHVVFMSASAAGLAPGGVVGARTSEASGTTAEYRSH